MFSFTRGGRGIDRQKGGSSTHLVATSCLLSCNHMKSEMKSKCCVYARMASFFRGSHSLHPHTVLYPQRKMERLLTLITPSSSPVASRCEVGCMTRLMGALQGEHAGFINAPPAWCDVATHSCAPWRVSDKHPVLVSMILYEPHINISHSIGLVVTQLKRFILSHRVERGTIWAQSQTATRSL
jgi:hypothetical protein